MNITTEAPDRAATDPIDLLAGWAGEQPQTLVSRRLVIDRLLDLRNLVDVGSRSGIDAILAKVPGVTVVEGSWWNSQIATLETRLAEQGEGTPS